MPIPPRHTRLIKATALIVALLGSLSLSRHTNAQTMCDLLIRNENTCIR